MVNEAKSYTYIYNDQWSPQYYTGQQKKFFSSAKNILTILEYFDVVESENDIGFFELFPVFEILVFFTFEMRKIDNFCSAKCENKYQQHVCWKCLLASMRSLFSTRYS